MFPLLTSVTDGAAVRKKLSSMSTLMVMAMMALTMTIKAITVPMVLTLVCVIQAVQGGVIAHIGLVVAAVAVDGILVGVGGVIVVVVSHARLVRLVQKLPGRTVHLQRMIILIDTDQFCISSKL